MRPPTLIVLTDVLTPQDQTGGIGWFQVVYGATATSLLLLLVGHMELG